MWTKSKILDGDGSKDVDCRLQRIAEIMAGIILMLGRPTGRPASEQNRPHGEHNKGGLSVPPRVPGPLAPAFRGFSPEVLNALHLSPTDLKHIETAATAGGPREGGVTVGPGPTGIEGQLGVRDWNRVEAQASNPRRL